MTPGTRVRTPDGREGTVEEVDGESAWVFCDQWSNVNQTELFKVEFLEVID